MERVPPLKVSWGHLRLTGEDLNQIGLVFAHMSMLKEECQIAPYMRYFATLALLAKSDIFCQFEPTLLV
jgi:hypothetical protein